MQIMQTRASAPIDQHQNQHPQTPPKYGPRGSNDFNSFAQEETDAKSDAQPEERLIDVLREAIGDIRKFDVKHSDQLKALEKEIETIRAALSNATDETAEILTRQLNALLELKQQLLEEMVLAQTQQGETADDDGATSTADIAQETMLTVFNLRVDPQGQPENALASPDTDWDRPRDDRA